MELRLHPDGPARWRLEPRGRMRVPAVVVAEQGLVDRIAADGSLEQLANVACLPGVVDRVWAMPDAHVGYGFPIGGVAATDVDAGGVVSPGGVGFDISCGVRLHASSTDAADLAGRLPTLMDALARTVPSGLGKGAIWRPDGDGELDEVLVRGAAAVVDRGYGHAEDLRRIEDAGVMGDADPRQVGDRARRRGGEQLGSLGAGNHFLEVQRVAEVVDEPTAKAWGLTLDRVVVMIHTGSRGLGHQVCSDQVAAIEAAQRELGIDLPDPQLAAAPIDHPLGAAYLAAMHAAANFARANRQLLGHAARAAFAEVLGDDRLALVYDLSHNLARVERREVDGQVRRLCVHRKGATPARPPGDEELVDELATTGQPVLVPGSMGSSSWVLAGAGGAAFASACHGAGRSMSRTKARKRAHGRTVRDELAAAGVQVRGASDRSLAEEAPAAYKDVDAVMRSCEQAGLATPVARVEPIGVVKG